MIIYDVDKILREEITINHRGKKYKVCEPTVKVWGSIQKDIDYELAKGEVEGYKWLIGTMVPEFLEKPFLREKTWKEKFLKKEIKQNNSTILDNALRSELRMMADICLKVLSGRGAEGKTITPESIMKKK